MSVQGFSVSLASTNLSVVLLAASPPGASPLLVVPVYYLETLSTSYQHRCPLNGVRWSHGDERLHRISEHLDWAECIRFLDVVCILRGQ